MRRRTNKKRRGNPWPMHWLSLMLGCPLGFIDNSFAWGQGPSGPQGMPAFNEPSFKERLYEGQTWQLLVTEIIEQLPQKVFISFDIDGLDPKLCPHTGTPVQGGFETEQIFYLLKKLLESGRHIVGFDLNEVGVSPNEWDENVGARCLFKLCNTLIASSQVHATVSNS